MAVGSAINNIAVLVAAVVNMAVGFLWYGPLFGKQWLELMAFDKKKIAEMKKKGMGPTMLIAFLMSLVMSYVLGHFIYYTDATTFSLGMQTGFWIWLGFFVPTMIGIVLWEGRPFKLYILNVLHYLVSIALMGGILAAWP